MKFFSKEKIAQIKNNSPKGAPVSEYGNNSPKGAPVSEYGNKNPKIKRYTILLVDDEVGNLNVLSEILMGDYNILTANNALEAIELINNYSVPENINLIISDQRMPQKTGVEFFKETLKKIPRTIRIILTGFTEIDTIIGAINDGQVYKFLAKPIEPKDLKITVKRALESYELEQKNIELLTQLKDLNSSLEIKVEERTIQLKEINELQKGMIEILVHDLKNPLSNILMFSKHIHGKSLSEEKTKEIAWLINRSGNHMAKMVENLLEITKIEQEKIRPDLEIFDILPLTEQTIKEFLENTVRKQIKINFTCNISHNRIYTDYTRTKQVIENLISNAIKFSPFDSEINVSLSEKDQEIILSVKDQGPGFTEEDKAKLFQKFTRLSAQPTGGEHSSGLGLSIVKKIVEVIGAKIWYESEYGKGTTFFISFPVNI